jgi:UDP-glucose 4-epimerase
MKILVTGGAGYIGSHACLELLQSGYEIVIIDNLSNSSQESLNRIKKISSKNFLFYEADLRDKSKIEKIFKNHQIQSVMHFAGFKSVNESISEPIKYYENNVGGTLILLEVMNKYNCKELIFSSSASVYGKPERIPVNENCKLSPINPYGRSKLVIENILRDLFLSDKSWKIALLRYFNPVGAHESGLLGECAIDIPSNLMPLITQVAIGKLKTLNIYGNDYNTKDGTGVRDYIHVVDLVNGHLKALNVLRSASEIIIANLGTGKGYSVFEVLRAFERVSGKKIPFTIKERRAGDSDICYTDNSHALKIMNWKAEYGIFKMCEDAWRWQCQNPNGYNQG